MTDIAHIGFDVDTQELDQANTKLNRMSQEGGRAEKASDRLGASQKRLASAAKLAAAAIASVIAALGVREIIRMADAYAQGTRLIDQFTSSAQETAKTMDDLFKLSQRNRQDFESTVSVYQRFRVATLELGLSNEDLFKSISGLQKAIVLSGVSSQEARSGMIQLSQGMASGRLQGEELRAVLESMPTVARAIADAAGISFGELREAASDGKIGVEEVLTALQNLERDLDISGTSVTVAESFTLVGNSLTRLVGKFSENSGAADILAGAIVGLSDAIDFLASNMNIVEGALAAAATALTAALIPAVGALKTALVGLFGLMAAHPIGLVVTAISLAVGALVTFRDETIKIGDVTVRVGSILEAAWLAVKAGIMTAIAPLRTIINLFGVLGGAVRAIINRDFDKLDGLGDRVKEAFTKPAEDAAGAWQELWEKINAVRNGTDAATSSPVPVITPAGVTQPKAPAPFTLSKDEGKDFQNLMDDLFPLQAAQEELKKNIELVEKAIKAKELTAEKGAEAIKRLREEYKKYAESLKEEVKDPLDEHIEQLDKSKNAADGVRRALLKYYRDTQDAAKAWEGITTRAMKKLEDSFVGVIKGTESISDAFKNMVTSIIEELMRLMIQQNIIGPLAGLLGLGGGGGGVFGAGGTGIAGGGFSLGGIFSGLGGSGLFSSNPFGSAGLFGSQGFFGTGALTPAAFGGGLVPFHSGGDFTVGGAGGIDSNIVAFRADKGERVSITPAAANMNDKGGGVNITIINENGGEVETEQNGNDVTVLIRKVVTDDINNGGQIFNSMRKTFNVQPQLTRRG